MAKTIDQYITACSACHAHLVQIYTIMFFAAIANTFLILTFAGSAAAMAKLALATLVVAAAVYSTLAVKSALDDLKAAATDAQDGLAGSAFGAYLAQIPVGFFNATSAVLNLLIAATQLGTIFSS
jgi:hypothetical protein